MRRHAEKLLSTQQTTVAAVEVESRQLEGKQSNPETRTTLLIPTPEPQNQTQSQSPEQNISSHSIPVEPKEHTDQMATQPAQDSSLRPSIEEKETYSEDESTDATTLSTGEGSQANTQLETEGEVSIEPSTTPESVASIKPLVQREHVYALPGDTISISLEGIGWLYTGEKDGKEGISFLSREYVGETTDFMFRVKSFDRYLVVFQRQNHQTGETIVKEVLIEVVSEEEFSDRIGLMEKQDEGGRSESQSENISTAERLLRMGKKEEALKRYLEQYQGDEPEINQRVAELAFSLERNDTAKRFWERNLSASQIYRDKAVKGLISLGIRMQDKNVIDTYIDQLFMVDTVSVENELLIVAHEEKQRGNMETASLLLRELLRKYPKSRETDAAYFMLGQIFEKKSEIQDVEKAINYYTLLIEKFPTSEFWFESQDRINYLNRYYFQIR